MTMTPGVEFKAWLHGRKVEAYEDVEDAYRALQKAREDYTTALLEAHSVGCANTEIARRIGLTETAVRMYIKRKLGDD